MCLRAKLNSKKGYTSVINEIKLFVEITKKSIYEKKHPNLEDRDRIWEKIKIIGDLKLHEIMLSIQTSLSRKEGQIEGLNIQIAKLITIK